MTSDILPETCGENVMLNAARRVMREFAYVESLTFRIRRDDEFDGEWSSVTISRRESADD